MPIEQKPIKPEGGTANTLREIRAKFLERFGQPESCKFDHVNLWLQAPVLPGGGADKNCQQRADRLAPLLNRSAKQPYSPNLAAPLLGGGSYQKRWELIDAALNENRVVRLEGPAELVGGPKSIFATGPHVILLLSVVQHTRPCYVGFDPDVSATESSLNSWRSLVQEYQTNDEGVKDLEPAQLHRLIKTMILGDRDGGVGPLIRKYYPDREKGFPSINRNLPK